MNDESSRAVLDASPGPVVAVGDDGRVSYANRAAATTLGRDRDSLPGTTVTELFEGWPSPARLAEQAREATALVLTARVRDDTVEFDCSLQTVHGEEPLVVAFLEERDLLGVETVVDAFADAFFVLDDGGTLLEYNDGFAAVTGYDGAELAGAEVFELVPLADRDDFAGAVEATLTDGSVETARSALVTRAGERVPAEFTTAPLPDAAGNVVGALVTARDVSERRAVQRALRESERRHATLLSNLHGIVYRCRNEPDWPMEFVSEGCRDLTGYTPAELERDAVSWGRDVVHPDDRERVWDAVQAALADDDSFQLTYRILTADGETRWVWEQGRNVTTDEDVTMLEGYITDVTDQQERETALAERSDELATLNRISRLLGGVLRSLVSATSREEIEETVCSRLTASDLYRFAWIGDRDLDGGVVARATAGDDGILDAVDEVLPDDEWERPAATALRTGKCQVVRDIPNDETFPADVRTVAREEGFHSGIAVPLTYDGTTYGVLVVYATRTDAFSDREAAGFDVLGETIWFAINAIEHRRLLTADSVVELTFQVTDHDALLVDLSARADCTLVLEGTVPASDGTSLYYVRVVDADPERIVDLAVAESSVLDAQVVTDRAEDGLISLAVSTSLVEVAVGSGASVQSMRAEDGDGRLVVEVAYDVDVRTLVGTLRNAYPDVELRARRDLERPVKTASEFREELASGLTVRQHAALQAAYRAGYFDWPRASTAEEVADSMNISSATFHQHLRTAQQKLVASFFDELVE